MGGTRPDPELGNPRTFVKPTKQELNKREFGSSIQKSLKNIFDGCHKDDAKTTLSLRAILYEVSFHCIHSYRVSLIFSRM